MEIQGVSKVPGGIPYDRTRLLTVSGTQKNYLSQRRAFLNWIEGKGLAMSVSALADYASELRNSQYMASTIKKRITGAKGAIEDAFLDSDEARDALARDHFYRELRSVKSVKSSRRVSDQKMLSERERQALYDHASKNDRIRVIMDTLIQTGLRVAELCSLRWSDVKASVDGTYIVRVMGKGSKQRVAYIPGDLLTEIRKTFGGKTWLFETKDGNQRSPASLGKTINRFFAGVIPKSIGPHMFRHVYVTILLEAGIDHSQVRDLAGHASVSTTLDMYSHTEIDPNTVASVMTKARQRSRKDAQ